MFPQTITRPDLDLSKLIPAINDRVREDTRGTQVKATRRSDDGQSRLAWIHRGAF